MGAHRARPSPQTTETKQINFLAANVSKFKILNIFILTQTDRVTSFMNAILIFRMLASRTRTLSLSCF